MATSDHELTIQELEVHTIAHPNGNAKVLFQDEFMEQPVPIVVKEVTEDAIIFTWHPSRTR